MCLLRSVVGLLCLFSVVGLSTPEPLPRPECLIPPRFDPGIGGVYFCSPAEGEQHLITHARRSYTEIDLDEDVWINLQGIFSNRVWINIGLQEAADASLPAWDALASIVEWMRAIKEDDAQALEAFLAPLEMNPTYSEADVSLQQRLLAALRSTSNVPAHEPLRVVLYHVHLRLPKDIEKRLRVSLNPLLSIPSHEDLFLAPRLAKLLPGSASKIAVAAGIWTYTWDREQADRFVAEHYDGPAEAPFALKYGKAYTRFAVAEYLKRGLDNTAAISTERLHQYIKAIRPTGASLHFAFASDWETLRQGEFFE